MSGTPVACPIIELKAVIPTAVEIMTEVSCPSPRDRATGHHSHSGQKYVRFSEGSPQVHRVVVPYAVHPDREWKPYARANKLKDNVKARRPVNVEKQCDF